MIDLSVWFFFVKGLLIGFVVAVPVGPVGLMCINRALSGGAAYGLVSGLGVATADAIAAGIAVLGLTLVLSFLIHEEVWFRLIGGLFLCYLGFKIFTSRAAEQVASPKENGLIRAYASMFFLAMTNPGTILSLLAICAGWGIGNLSGNYLSAALLISGVFFGSALWWFILASGLLAFGPRFTYPGLRWVHRISGVIIAGFGLIVLFGLSYKR